MWRDMFRIRWSQHEGQSRQSMGSKVTLRSTWCIFPPRNPRKLDLHLQTEARGGKMMGQVCVRCVGSLVGKEAEEEEKKGVYLPLGLYQVHTLHTRYRPLSVGKCMPRQCCSFRRKHEYLDEESTPGTEIVFPRHHRKKHLIRTHARSPYQGCRDVREPLSL